MAASKKVNALSFEKALEILEKSAETLKKDDIPLDEALKSYEEGIEYYNHCNELLTNAKQKIEVYKGDE